MQSSVHLDRTLAQFSSNFPCSCRGTALLNRRLFCSTLLQRMTQQFKFLSDYSDAFDQEIQITCFNRAYGNSQPYWHLANLKLHFTITGLRRAISVRSEKWPHMSLFFEPPMKTAYAYLWAMESLADSFSEASLSLFPSSPAVINFRDNFNPLFKASPTHKVGSKEWIISVQANDCWNLQNLLLRVGFKKGYTASYLCLSRCLQQS